MGDVREDLLGDLPCRNPDKHRHLQRTGEVLAQNQQQREVVTGTDSWIYPESVPTTTTFTIAKPNYVIPFSYNGTVPAVRKKDGSLV